MHNRKLLAPLLLSALLLSAVAIPRANATGLLYVNPPSQTAATSLPASFTYQIKVANIATLNGWDISVQVNPAVLNPTSLSVSGNLLAANFSATGVELIHCVNGMGMGCTSTDGAGIVHSSFVIFGTPPAVASISGLLFTITYSALIVGGGSTVHIFNDLITNGSPLPVPHTTQDGVYGSVSTADFSVSVTPASQSVVQGNSTTYIIGVTALGGFTGTVTLTATVFPTGPTTTFSTDTITGGSGTSSIAVSTTASTFTGNYTVTVTGTSSSLSHSVPVTLIVKQLLTPDFSIAVNPTDLTVIASYGSPTTVTLKSLNGFAGTVSLQAITSPKVVNAPFGTFSSSMATIAAGQSLNVTLTVSSFALTQTPAPSSSGLYTVIVIGTSGLLSHSDLAVVNVKPAVGAGIHWIHHFEISRDGAFQDFSYHIQNNSTSTLLVQANIGLRARGFTATLRSPVISVQGGNLTAGIPGPIVKTDIFFNVTAFVGKTIKVRAHLIYGAPDFIVTASPRISFPAGSSATSTITVAAVNGFTGVVSLTAAGAPAGCSATLSSTSISLGTSGTSTLTVSCSSAVPNFTVTVTGTSGTLSHSAAVAVTLAVTDFTVTSSPTSISFVAGKSAATSTITVTAVNGFTGIVSLTATGAPAPAGCTATLSPTSVTLGTSGTSTLTVSCSSAAVPNFTVTVTGTSGTESESATVAVTVTGTTLVAFSCGRTSSTGNIVSALCAVLSTGGDRFGSFGRTDIFTKAGKFLVLP